MKLENIIPPRFKFSDIFTAKLCCEAVTSRQCFSGHKVCGNLDTICSIADLREAILVLQFDVI